MIYLLLYLIPLALLALAIVVYRRAAARQTAIDQEYGEILDRLSRYSGTDRP